jgi:hypothetical protein
MRETSDWLAGLSKDLRAEGFPEEVMRPAEFCRVELGLYFLSEYFPGEPVGVLQPVLSGYVRSAEDIDAVIRRVRHRMGDVARRGYWRKLLNQYMRLPDSVRAFDRTDDPGRRVVDATVFVARPSSVCPDRDDSYGAALADSLPYRMARLNPPAEPGKRYSFPVGDGVDYVRLPDGLPAAGAPPRLAVASQRVREPWPVSFDDDLRPVARLIDKLLEDRPDITNRGWTKRLEKLRFSLADPDGGVLRDRPEGFTIDGTEHIVGLMNSGKTTLTDLITVDGVLNRGQASLPGGQLRGRCLCQGVVPARPGDRRCPADRSQFARQACGQLLANQGRGSCRADPRQPEPAGSGRRIRERVVAA